ncbi:MAG: pentapeptide repeat-containing protein [Methylococcales bacterium]|nr:pentapeptide repeat-containing protein [Methylococcales bacterium]MBT7408286.1 pentapeptide repeat-containing protein [Methylococcales bacterium]
MADTCQVVPNGNNNTRVNWLGCSQIGQNLDHVKMAFSDLKWSNFTRTSLNRANLFQSDLRWANLTSSKLFRANLSQTQLQRSTLRNTNLTQANLQQANLTQAIFGNTQLDKTNLSGAILNQSNLRSSQNLQRAFFISSQMHEIDLSNLNLNRPLTQDEINHNNYYNFYHNAEPVVCDDDDDNQTQSSPSGSSAPGLGNIGNSRAQGAVGGVLDKAMDKFMGGIGGMNPNQCTPSEGTWYWQHIKNAKPIPDILYEVGMKLSSADLTDSLLINTSLESAHLQETKFIRTNLSRANFSKANMESTDLTGAILGGITVNDETILKFLKLEGSSDIVVAEGEDPILPRALPLKWQLVWKMMNLPPAEWQNLLANADLSQTDLTSIKTLAGMNLTGTNFEEAKLDGIDFTGANLTRANLKTASLANAILDRANLTSATLSNATLDDASLIMTNLQSAKMSAVTLKNTQIINANMKGANLMGMDFGKIKKEWVIFPWYGDSFMKKSSNQQIDTDSVLSTYPSWIDLPFLLGTDLSGASWINGSKCLTHSIGKCKLKHVKPVQQ